MIVASGTGTTAYFLANYFASSGSSSKEKQIEVMAAPCVGSCEYLKKQMQVLDALSGRTGVFPSVLSTKNVPRRPFAKPNSEHMHIWKELQLQTGIEFDLIYAPRTFEILCHHVVSRNTGGPSLHNFAPEANLIYYHCGGAEGNESQTDRYKAAGLV